MKKLLLVASIMLTVLQGWCYPSFDTTVVTSSGQTLYLKIYRGAPSSLAIVAPNTIITSDGTTDYNWDGYTKPTGDIVIPSNYFTVPGMGIYGDLVYYNVRITTIEEKAFSGCDSLTSVTMNSDMRIVGNRAFYNCPNLEKVTFGESVTHIGDSAFLSDYALDSLVFLGNTPPVLSNSHMVRSTNGNWFSILPFTYTPSVRFIVPCGSYVAYTYGWPIEYEHTEFTVTPALIDSNLVYYWEPIKTSRISEEAPYPYGSPTVSVNEDSWGTAVAYSVNCEDSNFVLRANPANHYHFVRWSNGSTANSDTLKLTADSVIVAYFMPDQYTFTVVSGEPEMGNVSIEGYSTTTVTVNYGDTLRFFGIANEHYHNTYLYFERTGYDPTYLYSQIGEDTVTWYYTGIDANTVATMHFAIDTHTVAVVVNDSLRGMVEASGSRFTYGSPCRLTATAFAGYTFHGWSNGVTDNPYVFAVQEDMNLTAIFLAPGEVMYTVTVTSANPQMGTVSGGGIYNSGATATLTATANSGYHFTQWQDGNTSNPRTVTVTGDATYTAYFEADAPAQYTLTVTTANPSMGSVSGGGTYNSGSTATLTAIANSGYRFDHWQDNNTQNPRTITVTGNATYTAYFEAIQGIDDVNTDAVNVYTLGGQIVVETEQNDEIGIYDIVGRKVDGGRKTFFDVPASGVYLVKVGSMPLQKVAVIK